MDYAASLSEAQQQLLAQYQQHLQQQQQQQPPQQPQQQPQQVSQAYDPSQFQSYDPASQGYYSYPQAYQTVAAHHQHPQQYPYYTPDYGASAATAAAAASNAYQADAGSQAQDPSAVAQQYYPQDQQAAYNASLNPAAAAAVHALSQLTQFAGNMDAAERAVAEQQWSNGAAGQVPPQQAQVQHPGMVHPHAGGGPYRGGGRRGGGPFRGGKGNFGHRHQRQDGGSFRGRGRGRGGGRRFPQSAPEVQAPYPVHHPSEVPQPYAEPGTVYEPSQAAMPGPGPVQANAPSRRTPTVIFCELCRVECNSGEIFEKHKIGKRHKKNLQRLEELEHQKKLTAEADARQRRIAADAELQPKMEQPEHVHFDGEKATASQDAGDTDTANETTLEGGQQSQTGEQLHTPKGDMIDASAKKRKRDNIKKTPLKRKTSFVQDGKRMRMEVPRPETPKELPVHCALCNVTCDTMAVFQCHLSGKKHASRIKRSQIQTIAYVPPTGVALYIPYGAGYGQRPPPQVASEPVSQEGSVPTTLDHQAAVTEPASQHLTAMITDNLQAATADPASEQVSAMTTEDYQAAVAEPVDQGMVMVWPEGQNTNLESQGKDVNPDNALIPTAEYEEIPTAEYGDQQGALIPTAEYGDQQGALISTAEYGDQQGDHSIPPGFGVKEEEPYSGMELQ